MTYLIAACIFFVNIPFGVWRGSVRKLSLKWFLAIHIPVIISIAVRYTFDIKLSGINIILFIGAFFLGQLLGKRAYLMYLKNRAKVELVSNKD